MKITLIYKSGKVEQYDVYSFGYGKLLRKNSRNYYTWVTRADEKFHKVLADKIKDYHIQ